MKGIKGQLDCISTFLHFMRKFTLLFILFLNFLVIRSLKVSIKSHYKFITRNLFILFYSLIEIFKQIQPMLITPHHLVQSTPKIVTSLELSSRKTMQNAEQSNRAINSSAKTIKSLYMHNENNEQDRDTRRSSKWREDQGSISGSLGRIIEQHNIKNILSYSNTISLKQSQKSIELPLHNNPTIIQFDCYDDQYVNQRELQILTNKYKSNITYLQSQIKEIFKLYTWIDLMAQQREIKGSIGQIEAEIRKMKLRVKEKRFGESKVKNQSRRIKELEEYINEQKLYESELLSKEKITPSTNVSHDNVFLKDLEYKRLLKQRVKILKEGIQYAKKQIDIKAENIIREKICIRKNIQFFKMSALKATNESRKLCKMFHQRQSKSASHYLSHKYIGSKKQNVMALKKDEKFKRFQSLRGADEKNQQYMQLERSPSSRSREYLLLSRSLSSRKLLKHMSGLSRQKIGQRSSSPTLLNNILFESIRGEYFNMNQ